MSFFGRFFFAFSCLFRIWADGRFASRIASLDAKAEAPALAEPPPNVPAKAPTPKVSLDPALDLLALLQREGRLIDFLEEDIASFEDADIGAAARVVHEGCRKALRAHVPLEPVCDDEEGARVTLGEGYDASRFKLTGEVGAKAPDYGTLRHRGWRAKRIELPKSVGARDATVLAPAEVEIAP